MGIAHQLKMLAPVQVRCLECRVSYVPYSKDLYREQFVWWMGEGNWRELQQWAADRAFQSGMKFCCPNCQLTSDTRKESIEIERRRHKNYGKRK